MSKLQCWWLVVLALIFGIGDRTINSIINDYSVESLSQIIIGVVLLLLVNQFYPYNLGE